MGSGDYIFELFVRKSRAELVYIYKKVKYYLTFD